jgi:hypothetical protein
MRYHTKKDNKQAGNRYALWPIGALCGGLLLVILSLIARMVLNERPKASDIAISEVPAINDIRLQQESFPSGQLRLFRISGTNAVFALKRLADQRVHAALLSCTTAVCSRRHPSYARQNELMCGMCNQPMHFENDSATPRAARKHCFLPEVTVSEDGGAIMIATKDVLAPADRVVLK